MPTSHKLHDSPRKDRCLAHLLVVLKEPAQGQRCLSISQSFPSDNTPFVQQSHNPAKQSLLIALYSRNGGHPLPLPSLPFKRA